MVRLGNQNRLKCKSAVSHAKEFQHFAKDNKKLLKSLKLEGDIITLAVWKNLL